MAQQILFNAFMMNCVVHLAPGQWRAPKDEAIRYCDSSYWIDIARTLERGLFDGLFLGDVLGVYDVDGGAPAAALRSAAQVPMNDPFPLVPLMAQATRHLGFGITASASYEHPYLLARRFTTLDHLSNGRVAWNIVTSYLESGARSLGGQPLVGHDERYDRADDFLDVCYALWEDSWEDHAVLHGADGGDYADASRVHAIHHDGPYFRSEGIFQCEPSPQRTPLLFQAGGSVRGRRFAARHAECVFVGAPTREGLKRTVSAQRDEWARAGRAPDAVKVFAMFTVIVDADANRAQERLAALRARADMDGARVLLSGWTGIDLSRYRPDDSLSYVDTDAGQSALASFSSLDPGKVWTVRDAVEFVALGGRGPVVAGSPVEVADQLQLWVADTGIDGFNLAYVESPRTFTDIVDLLVPELQRRGAYKQRYVDGTLREKLLGRGPLLAADHPARVSRAGRLPASTV